MTSSRIAAIFLLMMLACIIQVAMSSNVTSNGYPRPQGMPDAPTVAYGKLPLTMDPLNAGSVAVCDWYGWVNVNYQAAAGAPCLSYVWENEIQSIVNVSVAPPAFIYYHCTDDMVSYDPVCYDRPASQIICTIGCFDLSNTTLLLPPVTYIPSSPAPPGTPPGTTIVKGDGGVFLQPPVPLLGWAIATAAAVLLGGAR